MDYKDWIQNKAEELALGLFGFRTDYDKLDEATRDWCYMVATELYKDHYADQIDAAYERAKDARLTSSIHIDN